MEREETWVDFNSVGTVREYIRLTELSIKHRWGVALSPVSCVPCLFTP